jgi:cysteine sulfinate desulfinase/cysteine desulfurase-like protein
MTNDYQRANEAVRVSLGLTTHQAELDQFLGLLHEYVTAVG